MPTSARSHSPSSSLSDFEGLSALETRLWKERTGSKCCMQCKRRDRHSRVPAFPGTALAGGQDSLAVSGDLQEYKTQICVSLSTDEVDVLPGNTVLDWITDAFKWQNGGLGKQDDSGSFSKSTSQSPQEGRLCSSQRNRWLLPTQIFSSLSPV